MVNFYSPATDFFSLESRVCVVTGATGLLGKQHCHALSDAGAHVVAVDLDARECERLADELSTQGCSRSLGIAADITKKDDVNSILSKVLETFGDVHVLVNNAAVNDMVEKGGSNPELMKLENYPLEAWERSFNVNVTGTFLCCQILGAHMAREQNGSIINIASTYGLVGPDQSLYSRPDGSQSFYKSPAYSATKGAVLALTRFLAAYWGKDGIRVNALSPGGVQNGQEDFFVKSYSRRTPLGRMAESTEYRGALVFLASDASSYMTGANLVVDGGWTAW